MSIVSIVALQSKSDNYNGVICLIIDYFLCILFENMFLETILYIE